MPRAASARRRCPRPSCRRRAGRPWPASSAATSLGRDLPDLIAFRLKKNVVIMFFAFWPTMSLARLRLSMRSGGVEVDQRAFDHAAEDRLRAPGTGRASSAVSIAGATASPVGDLRVAGRAAGHLVVLAVPGLRRRSGCVGDPGQRLRAQLVGVVAEARAPGPVCSASRGPNSLPSTRYGLRAHQAEQAHHLGDAGARRESGRA